MPFTTQPSSEPCPLLAPQAAEMLSYAHDTQHEKIIRGVAVGLSLIMYGREEGADALIEQMTRDQVRAWLGMGTRERGAIGKNS